MDSNTIPATEVAVPGHVTLNFINRRVGFSPAQMVISVGTVERYPGSLCNGEIIHINSIKRDVFRHCGSESFVYESSLLLKNIQV